MWVRIENTFRFFLINGNEVQLSKTAVYDKPIRGLRPLGERTGGFGSGGAETRSPMCQNPVTFPLSSQGEELSGIQKMLPDLMRTSAGRRDGRSSLALPANSG